MGRRSFSEAEASDIRQLLREKGIADAARQKTIRGRLRRNYEFFINEFDDGGDGFTASDFDELIARGTISILPTEEFSEAADAVVAVSEPSEQASVLPDVLPPNLRVVFCGTAAGSESARRGVYYAGPGNQFWPVLARIGLTPRQLAPNEYTELPKYGIGLTDLSKFTSGTDDHLAVGDLNVARFKSAIQTASPRVIAFNGKRAAEAVLQRSVGYGQQPEAIGQSRVFVLPSTSGAARGHWNESYWKQLADFALADDSR